MSSVDASSTPLKINSPELTGAPHGPYLGDSQDREPTENQNEMAKESLSHEERAERRRKIAMEVKKTKDPAAVMKKYGITYPWLRSACRENQVDCPPLKPIKRGPKSQTLAIIAQLILSQKDGSPKQEEIATQFGVTKQRVSSIKKEATEAGLLGKKAVWK